ncbi:MAG: D-sedoheptulose 7-phosphate isomerase [Deltaproteobacteria bacterium]|nr:D-sedoheptulose 7-phosphate isomerase [Deltaproteobacteria bacterium]
MEEIVKKIHTESQSVIQTFMETHAARLITFSEKIASAFLSDRKLLICGNGGSAADAQHMAAEFVNRFQLERPPLPAMALTTDTSVITSIGNDYTFEEIFSKQVKALGTEGDVLLAISTSGNSPNVVSAVEAARKQGLYTAALLGKDGGTISKMVDMPLVVACHVTARTQEAHILAEHVICHLVDYILFQKHLEE